jgi:hypothetical protein
MPDRREFLNWTVGVTVAGAATSSSADDPPSDPPAEPSADPVELWLARVKQAYPSDKITESALDEIRADIQRYLAASRVLASFPLENGDGPSPAFRAVIGT